VALYGAFKVAAGSEVVSRLRAVGATFTVYWRVATCVALSTTCAVNVNEPTAVLVPVMEPLLEMARPVGKPPADTDHVNGGAPPEAAIDWL
jgi:hypothetical protein